MASAAILAVTRSTSSMDGVTFLWKGKTPRKLTNNLRTSCIWDPTEAENSTPQIVVAITSSGRPLQMKIGNHKPRMKRHDKYKKHLNNRLQRTKHDRRSINHLQRTLKNKTHKHE